MNENPLSSDNTGTSPDLIINENQSINLEGVSAEIIFTAKALLAAKRNVDRWKINPQDRLPEIQNEIKE